MSRNEMKLRDAMHFERKLMGWSQAKLGEKAGISGGFIGMIEAGKREPSLKVLMAIAEALNRTTDDLLYGKNLGTMDDPVGDTDEERKKILINETIDMLNRMSFDSVEKAHKMVRVLNS